MRRHSLAFHVLAAVACGLLADWASGRRLLAADVRTETQPVPARSCVLAAKPPVGRPAGRTPP